VAGWGNIPSYYQTIQLTDMTGDGAAEVIGRSAQGMTIAQLQKATGTFSSLPLGPGLTDAAGWNVLPYALSIRSGDVDGDGQGEIFALNAGLQVVTAVGDAAKGNWTSLPASSAPNWPDWPPANGVQPVYYQTFQLADLDGDGDQELVALSDQAVLWADFDRQTNTWQALFPLPLCCGFNTPAYGGTLQVGDVDGQPGAELVVLDATQPVPNVLTFSYSSAAQAWTLLAQGPAWTEAATGPTDWYNPQYYTTFHLANLIGDADSGAEIVARGANGLVVAQWNAQSQTWVPQPSGAAPPLPDNQGWYLPQFYETMQIGDLDGDGTDEVFPPGTLAWLSTATTRRTARAHGRAPPRRHW
jgi:hypothetical protein